MGFLIVLIIGILIGKFLLPNQVEIKMTDKLYSKLSEEIDQKDDIIRIQKNLINKLMDEKKNNDPNK